MSAIVGVSSIVLKNRREIKTRQANLYMQIFHPHMTNEFNTGWIEVFFGEKWNTFEEYEDRYGIAEHPEDEAKVHTVASWCQALGVLIGEGLVDENLIYEHSRVFVTGAWDKIEPLIKGGRETYGHSYFDAFEWLAKRFKRRQEEERNIEGDAWKTKKYLNLKSSPNHQVSVVQFKKRIHITAHMS